jgi:predicted RNase H-like HicB family nuclease
MAAYIALLRKEPTSDYGVEFPDFPGCVTAGTDLEDARRMAAEALAFHLEGMAADGQVIPEPSSLETIMSDPDNRDAIGFLVDVPAPVARAVRINITLPADLVAAIDRVTRNRSRFLAEAAREKIKA